MNLPEIIYSSGNKRGMSQNVAEIGGQYRFWLHPGTECIVFRSERYLYLLMEWVSQAPEKFMVDASVYACLNWLSAYPTYQVDQSMLFRREIQSINWNAPDGEYDDTGVQDAMDGFFANWHSII